VKWKISAMQILSNMEKPKLKESLTKLVQNLQKKWKAKDNLNHQVQQNRNINHNKENNKN
jgi:hypothetical protein